MSGPMGIVGGQVASVDYAPQVVTELQCVWYHWKERLECTWELPPYDMKYIDVEFIWYNGAMGLCSNMSDNKTTCIFHSDIILDTSPWFFKITVTNTRLNVSAVGPYIEKIQHENVKPNKVDWFGYEYVDNSSCVLLKWSYDPFISRSRKKQFRVQYVSSSGEQKEEINEDTGSSMLVCDLDPDTSYTFTIDVKAVRSHYYSDPVTISVTTDEDVPLSAPELQQGAYQRNIFNCLNDSNGYHDVNIYWKKVPRDEARGVIVNYIINTSEYQSADEINARTEYMETNYSSNYLSGTVHLKCGAPYIIKMTAATKKGLSKTWSYLRIPPFSRKGPSPPPVFVEEGGEEYKVNFATSPLDGQTGYTIFYCQRKNNTHCEGELLSTEMKPTDTRYASVVVPDTEVEYLFGVSRDFNFFGSGFVLISCVYHKTAVPPPPSGIRVSSRDSSQAMVTWNHVTCSENTPLIFFYTIKWCKIFKEKIQDEDTCINRILTIPLHQSALFLLEEIDTDYTYSVQIRSSSAVQSSVFSDPVYFTLTQKDTVNSCEKTTYLTQDVLEMCLIVVVALLSVTCIVLLSCFFRHRSRREKGDKFKS
ncbi:protogenin A-like [Ylistrum balloti]|uniref:protogenin A-like n=1 Tax=Ylistrum balloti TaxID=509963 RepID=UPI002905B9A1|nr:protogenin A-like [Ylistrum balloti]